MMKQYKLLFMLMTFAFIIGTGCQQGESRDHGADAQFHTDGFSMDVNIADTTSVDEATTLQSTIAIDEEPLVDARVRYEIWPEDDEDSTNWVNSDEIADGTYEAEHTFTETGLHYIEIDVEGEDDLHEHITVEIDVVD